MKSHVIVLAVVSLFGAAACATRPPAPKLASIEPFLIERDLVGNTTARGEFKTITGVRRRFTAYLNGVWDGETLTLLEDFEFDDGERDRKTWRITRIAPGEYEGSREDVVGKARGYQDGPFFRLEYDVLLPNGEGTRKVRFRDVMALEPSGVIINNATVGWFGFRVGSVSLRIEPPEAPRRATPVDDAQAFLATP
jgi:hypothetical protein